MTEATVRKAELDRMVTPEHTCPWGLKALDLLIQECFGVEDHPLRSLRKQTPRLRQQRAARLRFVD